MNILPLTRSSEIVVQDLDQEILIYDLNTHKAYNLNPTSAAVYRACDGKTTFEELTARTKLTNDLIYLALDEFRKNDLIDNFVSPFVGMNRREVIRKVGLASMIALPLVTGMIAPTAAQASSTAVCTRNVCIRAGQNICAGCPGQRVTLTSYNSNDGSCTGARNSFQFICGDSFFVDLDYSRS